MITVLENFRKDVLLNVLMLRQPTIEERKDVKKEYAAIKNTEEKKEEPKIKTVKFKENIEQFVGKNLEVYGPFSQDDEAKLPSEIAQILVKQGKVEEV